MLHDASALTALTVEDLGTPERQEARLCTPQHPVERRHCGALVNFFQFFKILVQSFIGDSEEDWATSCLLAELQAYLAGCLLQLLQDAISITKSTTSKMRHPHTLHC